MCTTSKKCVLCLPHAENIDDKQLQQDQLALKIVLPEKLTAITVDPKGKYCAGATAQGRIFLWEARTLPFGAPGSDSLLSTI